MSMKTNKFLRIASVLLIAVLLTTCVISGTFAKYISTAEAQDSARVAKWSFKVGGQDIAQSEAITFDLFNTVADTDTVDGDDANDADVKDGATETIIAPGTKGNFAIEITNASEVSATYAIDFELVNANNIPLEFSLTGADDSWEADIADINVAAKKLMYDSNNTATVNVYWRWVFGDSANNDTDTALGAAGTATATVTANITAAQVD